MAKLQINTGAKSYDIEDKNGKMIGTIVIYPSDYNLGKRTEIAQENIVRLVTEAEKVANDESKTEKEIMDYIYELDSNIKAEIDNMFNSNVSETVFKGLNCLNLNDGKYFIERFMEMIVPVVTEEMESAAKASSNRINKYTSQASKR